MIYAVTTPNSRFLKLYRSKSAAIKMAKQQNGTVKLNGNIIFEGSK